MEFLAHSRNRQGQGHLLVDHLTEVAKLAREFASASGAGEPGYHVGLWHDLGEFSPQFQTHLAESAGRGAGRRRGPDHEAPRAYIADKGNPLLFRTKSQPLRAAATTSVPSDSRRQAYLLFCTKLARQQPGAACYPLLCHMVDVAKVALAVWQDVISPADVTNNVRCQT